MSIALVVIAAVGALCGAAHLSDLLKLRRERLLREKLGGHWERCCSLQFARGDCCGFYTHEGTWVQRRVCTNPPRPPLKGHAIFMYLQGRLQIGESWTECMDLPIQRPQLEVAGPYR